jgi:hypothetical protein
MKKINFKLLKNLSPELKKKILHLIKEKEKIKTVKTITTIKTVKTIKNNEENLKMIYDQMFDCMIYLLSKTNEPQMIASTMMAQALRLYKTVFKSEIEFKEVIDTILKQKNNIQPFKKVSLH